MQPGLQLLHTKRAGCFQRGAADGHDDWTAETDSKRDGFHRDYRRRADAASGYRGVGGSGAVRMQVPLVAPDHEWHIAGPEAANTTRGNGAGGEPGCFGGRPDKSAFETGGVAEGAGESGAGE